MFTGIIEGIGVLKSIKDKKNSKEFIISMENLFDDINIGDSISINGVCLTITEIKGTNMSFDIINETLNKSNLGTLSIGHNVNLERALRMSSRFNGHILQGHVEAVGVIIDYKKNQNEVVISVGIDPGLLIYCLPKGSIAFDGISLTIAKTDDSIIDVALIPHTLENTTLGNKKIGDSVNIETDIIGKYIFQFISQNENFDDINSMLIKTLSNLGLS